MRQFINGEEIVLKIPPQLTMVCCDCNLTHTFLFDHDGKMLKLTSFRNDFLTKKYRKRKKKKINLTKLPPDSILG